MTPSQSWIGIALVFAGCHPPLAGSGDRAKTSSLFDCGWSQLGGNAAHTGSTCAVGQGVLKRTADVVYDPFVPAEQAESNGDLLAHYQAALTAGDDVYMETKTGHYVSCTPAGSGTPAPCGTQAWNQQVWNEVAFHLEDGRLVQRWSFASDWKPEPTGGDEPLFHGALWGPFVYVPGAGGTIYQLERWSGTLLQQIRPLGATTDPDTYVAGPLTVDDYGSVYYNVLKLDHDRPLAADAQGFLVKAYPWGETIVVDYPSLVSGAPAPGDHCRGTYDRKLTPLPFPPAPGPDGALPPPPGGACLSQRPPINLAPAIGPDGTLFTVSRAHGDGHYAFVVAVDAEDLSPRWTTSLRGILHDGCGVLAPADGTATANKRHCRVGAPLGIDPQTGEAPAGLADDDSSSSPVALPDGGVLYGALTLYNGFRGHLFKLDASGAPAGTYDYGWDITPAVFEHDGSYSIVLKDNHYVNDTTGEDGPYFITQLDRDLKPEWKFQATNTKTCTVDPTGALACTDDHPNGFEWCVNAPAVDAAGNVFTNSEDGRVYVIGPGGVEKEHLFLNLALGAAYTPISLTEGGLLLTQNAGHLSVVGN